MKDIKQKLFSRWAAWSVDNAWKALLIVLIITVLFSIGFVFLKMEMTFYSLMPQSSSKVRDMTEITENFSFSSQISVVVDGRRIEDPDEAEKKVIELILLLEEEFTSDEYADSIEGVTAGLDRSFFREHMMMLVKAEDQKRFADLYSDLNLVPYLSNLNNDYESEYSGNDENLEDDEAMVVSQFRGLERLLEQLAAAIDGRAVDDAEMEEALDEYIFGETYFLSRDNRMGVFFIRPTFNINDYMEYSNIVVWEERAAEIALEYGLKAGLTGMIVVGKDEMVSSEEGLAGSMITAFILIIGLMILIFRMKSVPFIVGIPLVVGVLWTIGLSGWTVQRLNIVTAMYMIALIGLGVDYAVHILAAYIQERVEGRLFRESMVNAMKLSGPGILTGGLTTSVAFFALGFAKTELVSELGIVAGLGILCELAAMILIVPPLLALRQRRLEKRGKTDRLDGRKQKYKATFTGAIGRLIAAKPVLVFILLAAAGFLLSTQAGRVELEDNLMNMEAKGLTSIELQDTMVEEFGMAPDGLFLLTKDLDEAAELTRKLDKLESVKSVESVSYWLPTDDEYRARKPLVDDFSSSLAALPEEEAVDAMVFLDELFRLETNLIEMGDMAYLGQMERLSNTLDRLTGLNEDGVKVNESVFDRIAEGIESEGADSVLENFQRTFGAGMKDRLVSMSGSNRITKEDLPEMAKSSYISKDSNGYLISIVPRQNPWNSEFRNVFRSQVESVSEYSTGMILVSDQLLTMATGDSANAVIAAVILVFIILLIDFRNIKMALLTFVPLLFSVGALIGLMAIFGIKFDFLNIISIPLLIGIGIDDSVHINHRYRIEGPGKMASVIEKTGTAVFMTTVTTIIGFASFIPSIMRAMRSTGIVLSLAMALTFMFSVLLHPALLMIVNEKFKCSLRPWGQNKNNLKDNNTDMKEVGNE